MKERKRTGKGRKERECQGRGNCGGGGVSGGQNKEESQPNELRKLGGHWAVRGSRRRVNEGATSVARPGWLLKLLAIRLSTKLSPAAATAGTLPLHSH